jgi:hypothetical protein
MENSILIDILGWIGVAAVLAAYFMVSSKRFEGDSVIYQLLNLVGAGLLIINSSFAENRRRRWQARRGYKKLVDSIDKINKENPNGNASLCVDCCQCLEKYPQNINIPVELEKTHTILGKREIISQYFD